MITDGAEKRKGRFLKKGTRLFDLVEVEDYNFSKIREYKSSVYPDNPNFNIIHKRFHEESEISKKVLDGEKKFDELIAKNLRNQVIRPRDFTSDWIEEKKKAKRRSANKEFDEDEFEMQMEEEEYKMIHQVEENDDDDDDEVDSDNGTDRHEINDANEVSDSSHASDDLNQKLSNMNEMTRQSQASFDDLKREEVSGFKNVEDAIQSFSSTEKNSIPGEPAYSGFEHKPDGPAKSFPSDLNQDIDGKLRTIELKEQELNKKMNDLEHQRKELAQEIDSFRKTSKQFEEKVAEVKNLRKDSLGKAQENFYQITEALSEAIFQKSINLNPSLFKNLVDKIIRDSSFGDQYRVKVNPIFLETFKSYLPEDQTSLWQADDNVAEGEFVVENENSSIKSDLKQIVKEMLSDIDLDIFQEPKEDVQK